MRAQLQEKERRLTSGQAAVRDTESRLQELRSKIAGYEDTQQAYQACSLVRMLVTRDLYIPRLEQY